MIASDYTPVMRQIAATLVNEDRMTALFELMKRHGESSLPRSFECLFAVRVAPAFLHEAGDAKPLVWRSY
jgi:hypothetical protein